MKLYSDGEKSKAICPTCATLRATTFRERTVPLSSGQGSVDNVLVGVCDSCDTVVSIPQQSVPRVKETIEKVREPLETRVPRHLLDALALSCDELGFSSRTSLVLFRYYVHTLARNKRKWSAIARLASSPEAAGRSSARFSAKLSAAQRDEFSRLKTSTNLNDSMLVKGVFLQIKHDILDKRDLRTRRAVQEVLAIAD